MRYFFGQKIIQKSLAFLGLLFMNTTGSAYADSVDSILQEYNQKML